jgi:hypothetical protein
MWRPTQVFRCGLFFVVFLLPGTLGIVRCHTVRADGVMLPRIIGASWQMVASPRQEALITCADGVVQVTLRTSFRAGPTDLAWVVPVPHVPDRVERADDEVFTDLAFLTMPVFYARPSGAGVGCACDSSPPKEVGRVAVAETGEAGIFDYTVLTASGTVVLAKWLKDHGYYVPDGAEDVFQRYVDRGWVWLAIRLNTQRCDKNTVAPHPIRYTYRDQECVYPLVISRLSADEDNEILLYVVSTQPYACENWRNGVIPRDQLRVDRSSMSHTNYEDIFRSLTDQAGGHLFVTECLCRRALEDLPDEDRRHYAESLGRGKKKSSENEGNDLFITRLRAVVSREAMDRDVVLVPREIGVYHPNVGISNHFTLPREGNEALVVAIALFAGLLVSGAYLLHRRVRRRGAAS